MIEFHVMPSMTLQLGGFSLPQLSPRIIINHAEESVTWNHEGYGHFCGKSATGNWQFDVTEAGESVSLKLRGQLKHPVDHAELILFSLPEMDADHLFVQGLKMGGCDLRPLAQETDVPQSFVSYYHCLITKSGQSLMVSMPMRQHQPGSFSGATVKGKVMDFKACYTLDFYRGTDVELDPVTIQAGDGFELLGSWSDQQVTAPKTFPKTIQVGWNSWDYYRWTITEEEVLKNADFIAHDPVLSKHVKRIIVDDGWQYCYGEWDANPYFPHGMDYLARELTKMGFEPGLWFAPSIVEPHSRIAQLHPEMMALSEGGQPCLCYECMQRYGFALDPTVPKVQEHLRNLFSHYADLGYKYFKLDFLETTLRAARFHDGTVPRTDIIRRLVEPIYQAVRGKSQILGCNYPFHAGYDYVDAVRVGGDIHAIWNNIKYNTVSVAARFWANRKLWINDPDFALCRGPETSDDHSLGRLNPCWGSIQPQDAFNDFIQNFNMGTATRCEVEVILGVVLMTAGAINFSDDMTKLNDAGLKLARLMASARPAQAARPLDLFSSALPAQWLQTLLDGGKRLMLVNWTDGPQNFGVDLLKLGFATETIRDLFADTSMTMRAGTTLSLPPHSCKVLESL